MHDFRTEPNTNVVPMNTRVAETYDSIQQSTIARNRKSKIKNIFSGRNVKGTQERKGFRNLTVRKEIKYRLLSPEKILCVYLLVHRKETDT